MVQCPICRNSLSNTGRSLTCGEHSFPIIEGVPDLRVNPVASSYDQILPEWSEPGDIDLTAYGVKPNMVQGKRVCVAGAGVGLEINALQKMQPAELHAVEYSDFVRLLAKRFPSVTFYQADVCQMPFVEKAFDITVSGGVIQHTRSPREAVESLILCSKKLAVANTYPPNLHNRKVTANRQKYQFHMDPERGKRQLRAKTRAYYFLMRTGLWKLHRVFPIPGIPQYCNLPGHGFDFYYENALDYYLCRYRHMISGEEFESYCNGATLTKTPKGYLVE